MLLLRLLSFILCLNVFAAFSQKEANIWYFGTNAGLDFNSGNPVPLTNGVLSTREGCASIADANGRLLFYTDGLMVWNKSHIQMPNGFGLLGNSSSTQSAIIVPKPASSSIYYIFTVDAVEYGLVNGLNYSTVDMNMGGGLGDISTKNVALIRPTCEKITAVRHANNRDIWVVTHQWSSDAFYAYLVTTTGVSTTPVISHTGVVLQSNSSGNPLESSLGYLKASPDGNYLGIANFTNPSQLFLFNNSTGTISNPITLPVHDNPYGLEFSPNSKVLYLADYSSTLYQYDLNAANIPLSEVGFLSIGSGGGMGALQLATDGKIYSVKESSSYVSVINKPNVIGTGCDYTEDVVALNGRSVRLGLPPFIQSFFVQASFTWQYTCYGDITQFNNPLARSAYDSIRWNFGDSRSGTANTSSMQNPNHVFSDTGHYPVRQVIYFHGAKDTSEQTVIISRINVNLGNDITICSGGSVLLNPHISNASYLWSDNSTNPTNIVSNAGPYWVRISVNNCTASDTIDVYYGSIIRKTINAQICPGELYTLPSGRQTALPGTYTDTIKNPSQCDTAVTITITAAGIKKTKIDTLACDITFYKLPSGRTVSQSGTYIDSLRTTGGCDSIVTTSLQFDKRPVIQLIKDTTICVDSTIMLIPVIQHSNTYHWQDNSTAPVYSVSKQGVYIITAENICGEVMQSVNVVSKDCNQCDLYLPNAFSPNDDGINDLLMVLGICKTEWIELKIYDRWGELVFSSGSINMGWNGIYKGNPAPVDEYIWTLHSKMPNVTEEIHKKGSVTLVR
jgi:gliding motility-associated-like protein